MACFPPPAYRAVTVPGLEDCPPLHLNLNLEVPTVAMHPDRGAAASVDRVDGVTEAAAAMESEPRNEPVFRS